MTLFSCVSFAQVPKKAFDDYRGKDKTSIKKQQNYSSTNWMKKSTNPIPKNKISNPDKENKKRARKLARKMKKDKRRARRVR
ncbi:MAG: hypothetical protein JKY33_03925 [Bacteroidia bacterium]|nr:hypothetical protein [Bacteroidia bacterium]